MAHWDSLQLEVETAARVAANAEEPLSPTEAGERVKHGGEESSRASVWKESPPFEEVPEPQDVQ